MNAQTHADAIAGYARLAPFIPVVTVDPPVIDLADMVGNTWQVNLSISNHGLLAAQDCHLDFVKHPRFKFTPLIGQRLAELATISRGA